MEKDAQHLELPLSLSCSTSLQVVSIVFHKQLVGSLTRNADGPWLLAWVAKSVSLI